MLQTVRVEKVDQKNWVICLIIMFPSSVMLPQISRKKHILPICADFSKKSKADKAIYILHLKVFITLF